MRPISVCLRAVLFVTLSAGLLSLPLSDAEAKRAGGGKNQAPVAFDFTAPSILEDGSAVIELVYTDREGDLASQCTMTSSTIRFNRQCACDEGGVCTVEAQGLADASGVVTFDYTVTAQRKTSNAATVTLDVLPVNDPPVATSFTHPTFAEDSEEIVTLPYTDPDDLAQSCSVSDLDNVTETSACLCTAGVCEVGVTGTPAYAGLASFQFMISDGALDSLPATASLAIGSGVVAMRIPAEKDYFGFSVAAFGSRLVVGAPGESDGQPRVGAAYVYIDPDGNGDWSDRELQARLTAADGQAGDYFGAVVEMSDGVIAVLEDTESWGPFSPNQLHVFVDALDDGNWVEQNVIDRPPSAGHWGGGVWSGPGFDSLDIDGARIVVGAYQDSAQVDFSGAVYIYEDPNADKDWSDAVMTRLEASDVQESASYGRAVAIDGDVLVVGSPRHDSKSKGPLMRDTGAIYIYRHDGSSWVEEARIWASDRSEWLAFGSTVDIDGDIVVASAEGESEQGAVYVIRYADGVWAEQTNYRIEASNGEPSDQFGSGGVKIVGNKIFVGAPFEDGALSDPFANDWVGSGAMYVVEDLDANGDWSNAVEHYLKPQTPPDLAGETHDFFGSSFDVTGSTLIVGAFDEDSDGALPPNDDLHDSGAAYLFVDANRDGQWNDWLEHLYMK